MCGWERWHCETGAAAAGAVHCHHSVGCGRWRGMPLCSPTNCLCSRWQRMPTGELSGTACLSICQTCFPITGQRLVALLPLHHCPAEQDVYKTAEAAKAAGGNVVREPGPVPGTRCCCAVAALSLGACASRCAAQGNRCAARPRHSPAQRRAGRQAGGALCGTELSLLAVRWAEQGSLQHTHTNWHLLPLLFRSGIGTKITAVLDPDGYKVSCGLWAGSC